jgi:hypothetical protein
LANLVPAFACTTFASFNGADNTLVMAKNRDNRPDHQVIEVVVASGKYKYLALSRQDVPDFVSAGINEKNLAVFNEVTVEYSAQAKGGIADDFSKDILQNYAHARDVIPDIAKLVAKYPDPVFYQVADGKQILSIEVAPNHKFSYTLVKQGSFAHTNNYLIPELIKNYPYSTSENARLLASSMRLNRASYLVSHESSPSLETLQTIALDHSAGNNDSILRSGESHKENSVRSLAFFGVQIAHDGDVNSQVSANLYTVGEKYHYTLNDAFWRQYSAGITILSANSK